LHTEAQNSNKIRLNCDLYWEGIDGVSAMYVGSIHRTTLIYLRRVHYDDVEISLPTDVSSIYIFLKSLLEYYGSLLRNRRPFSPLKCL
jgi:hypothetical protein